MDRSEVLKAGQVLGQWHRGWEQHMMRQHHIQTVLAVPSGAPETWEQIKEEYVRAQARPHTFRVFSGGGPNIYPGTANTSFRFVHDMLHIELGADLSITGEVTVASYHANLAKHDRSLAAPEDRLKLAAVLLADTAGQAFYSTHHGKHVVDQIGFAVYMLQGPVFCEPQAFIQHARAWVEP